jgi:pseudouridine-5'-phosphate glycosidase
VITLRLSEEVSVAIDEGSAVVAMESTIFSTLGLPAPANAEALERCTTAVRTAGAVPAVTAIINGEARVGLDDHETDLIFGEARKVAERDLAVAIAQGWAFGATTVSASVALAHAAGISVFATGGIGGVHRGAEITGDISADLDALAHHPVVTVCAGAKAFLDLARTLEYLETVGVPVLGWRHDDFPAFYTRSSGLSVPHRVETAAEVAAVLGARSRLDTGVLVAVPIPEAAALDATHLDAVLEGALQECAAAGITGAAITPFVLGQIAVATDGRSLPANLALAEHNAAVAGDIALAISQAQSAYDHNPELQELLSRAAGSATVHTRRRRAT